MAVKGSCSNHWSAQEFPRWSYYYLYFTDIHIEDQIRSEAKDTLRMLHSMGVRSVMLTGDNLATAKEVSATISVEEYYADLLPEDKVRLAEQLRGRYGS